MPRGLHVRMNMQTNEVEAKLMEKDEKTTHEDLRAERKRSMADIQKSAGEKQSRMDALDLGDAGCKTYRIRKERRSLFR